MSARALERIVDRAEVPAVVDGWRRSGERVVVCGGVFDLLHVGHARNLDAARTLGDRLVVLVHGDETAATREGPGRPVMCSEDRAALVAALRAVDLVVLVKDSTVNDLLRELGPAIHVRGVEAGISEAPGRDAVTGSGPEGVLEVESGNRASRELVLRVRQRYAGRS